MRIKIKIKVKVKVKIKIKARTALNRKIPIWIAINLVLEDLQKIKMTQMIIEVDVLLKKKKKKK